MKRIVVVPAALLALLSLPIGARQSSSPTGAEGYRGWAAYGGGPEQLRYSGLRQITRENVQQLQVAWTYESGGSGDLQAQPVIVDGVLYAYSPTHRAFALDAATGTPLWTFDSGIAGRGPNRGVMYWAAGEDRRVFAAVDQYVYAINAATGEPISTFGVDGRIDLRENLDRPVQEQSVRLTTPGVVFEDLVIVGGRVSEGLPASPGAIRAYDARTGRLRWKFNTIPRPGEFGHDTWAEDSWIVNGGANSWAGMAVDVRRGTVYVPTGSASADFYGGNRPGDNLFANSLIAIDAATGRRIWHFQMVRHDIWDRDLPSPPTLITLRRNGQPVDAVVQNTKHGYLFVFDRTTGESLFPLATHAYPASDVPGEWTAPAQVLPTRPEPFARQRLTEDLLTTRTPEANAWAREQFATFRSGGQFVPFSTSAPTVVLPGFDGGPEWGGAAADPETGIYYVNANDLAWTGRLAPSNVGQTARGVFLRDCATCHRDDLVGTPPTIPSLVGVGTRRSPEALATTIRQGAGRMAGFPWLEEAAVNALVRYLIGGEDSPAGPLRASSVEVPYRFTGYRKFLDPDGYPATAPPWGTLNAIDLNTGAPVWRVPLGEYPELAAAGLRNTGTENYGGPIVTAGGLVFIGATNYDRKFRAFDKATGELLWETTLPFSGNATPATYEVDGRQYVVIFAGGGKSRGPSGGTYVAFALPR